MNLRISWITDSSSSNLIAPVSLTWLLIRLSLLRLELVMWLRLTHLNSITIITLISRKIHNLTTRNTLPKLRILVSAPYPSLSSSQINKFTQTSQTLTWTNFNLMLATAMKLRIMPLRLLQFLHKITSTMELISQMTSKSIYHLLLELLKLEIRTLKTSLLNIISTFITLQIKHHLMFLSWNSLCSKLMLKLNSTH